MSCLWVFQRTQSGVCEFDKIIDKETVVKIKWPNCDVTSAKSMKKATAFSKTPQWKYMPEAVSARRYYYDTIKMHKKLSIELILEW